MKAIVYREYGSPDVLKLRDVETPIPQADEVLIKVHATTVTTGDVNMRGFVFVPPGFGFAPRLMFGLTKPKKQILGTEVAGIIADIGANVTDFKVGDEVFGIDSRVMGAYAEYVCRPAAGPLVHKPANIGYDEATAVPFGATTALYFLRDKGEIQPGQKVLVRGASGGVGSYAVQLAKYFGAEVTGICSTRNIELVYTLGADKVIDYTKEDFTQKGETYDLLLDTVVGQTDFNSFKRSLTPHGRYLAVAGGLRAVLQMGWSAVRGGQKIIIGSPPERKEELLFLTDLLEAGHIRPVIDRCYPLAQMADAHRYVDSGRKRGAVVIHIISNESSNAKE